MPRGIEAVVEDVVGPNEEGTGWCVTLRIGGGSRLLLRCEAELEPTGLAENDVGEPVPVDDVPPPEERRDRIELRLVTDIADGIDAARVAATVERELLDLVGEASVSTEAERHWSDPFNYELTVTVEPMDDPVTALRELAEAGGDGWISCSDDGWRCDLWWSDAEDEDAEFLVPEVRGAEVVFLPWRSPRRRPEAERPLVEVQVPGTVDEPRELDGGPLDPEPGDEEA